MILALEPEYGMVEAIEIVGVITAATDGATEDILEPGLLSINDKTVTGLVTALGTVAATTEEVISGCSDLESKAIIEISFEVTAEAAVTGIFDDFDALNAEDAIAITVSAAALATSLEMGVFEK